MAWPRGPGDSRPEERGDGARRRDGTEFESRRADGPFAAAAWSREAEALPGGEVPEGQGRGSGVGGGTEGRAARRAGCG